MNFDYINLLDSYPDTGIVLGKGCFMQFATMLEHNHEKNIIAFTGKNSFDKNGGYNRFMRGLRHNMVNMERFSDIEPEPSIKTVERMIKCLENYQPDAVIAIGGGSVMDAAKAAYLVYQAGGEVSDYFGVNKFSEKNPGKTLKKVYCYPTTAGSGSEVTPYSNIIDEKTGTKRLIVETEIIPEFSFIFPELYQSCPDHLTKVAACDALAHSIEGFLNYKHDEKHPEANTWALKSIELIINNLPKVLANPKDHQSREALAIAACLGGMVIRYKSTGLPHLCSFSWSKIIDHGLAVAIVLPYAWDYYLSEKVVQERTLELKTVFNVDSNNPHDIIQAYRNFLASIEVKTSLKGIKGITKDLLEKTAKSASENKMKLELSPKPVPLDQSYSVLSEILNKASS